MDRSVGRATGVSDRFAVISARASGKRSRKPGSVPRGGGWGRVSKVRLWPSPQFRCAGSGRTASCAASGRGGMGIVYLGQDEATGGLVVIVGEGASFADHWVVSAAATMPVPPGPGAFSLATP